MDTSRFKIPKPQVKESPLNSKFGALPTPPGGTQGRPETAPSTLHSVSLVATSAPDLAGWIQQPLVVNEETIQKTSNSRFAIPPLGTKPRLDVPKKLLERTGISIDYDRSLGLLSNVLFEKNTQINKILVEPSQIVLNEIFDYYEGKLIWKKQIASKIKLGTTAGALSTKYMRVRLFNKSYMLHRLIWVMLKGAIPYGKLIDHINGDTLDNRIENLRLASLSENRVNSTKSKGQGRFKGVYWFSKSGRWISSIRQDGKTQHIGYFDTEIEAAEAFVRRARILHGEFYKPQEEFIVAKKKNSTNVWLRGKSGFGCDVFFTPFNKECPSCLNRELLYIDEGDMGNTIQCLDCESQFFVTEKNTAVCTR
jgi:hypothetical protein